MSPFSRFVRRGVVTHGMIGRFQGWNNYPRQEHATQMPLYATPPAQAVYPDSDGSQASPSSNLPALSQPIVAGTIDVAPYEATLIAQSEQSRHSVGEAAVGQVATLRSELNRVDYLLRREVDELETVYAAITASDGRAFEVEFKKPIFWGLAALIIAAEVPLNKVVLDAFQVGEWESWVVAIWLGVINFIAAKFVGKVLRQRSWETKDWAACSIAFCATVGVLFALYNLALLREGLPAPKDPAMAMVEGSPMALYALQAVAFVGCIAWSYFQVDPDRVREQLTARAKRIEGRTSALWSQRVTLAQAHNSAVMKSEASLSNLIHDCRERVSQFRDGNLSSRTGEVPSYLLTAIPTTAFQPIQFGTPVDTHPPKMVDLLAQLKKREVVPA